MGKLRRPVKELSWMKGGKWFVNRRSYEIYEIDEGYERRTIKYRRHLVIFHI